ncbi:MAG TPA: chorismate synthase [Syntrophomonadaceae bacterium]|nr:chorismate synthase [Syntrophomonadaceae bacterium]
MIKFSTSGESHGQGLLGIIEGMPAGLTIDLNLVNHDLVRRQQGYGRGGRMKIESDQAEILAGVRNGQTLGSPIAFLIRNQDYENWQEIMNSGDCARINEKVVKRPRPGHADLTGAMKYNQSDMRNILERASARETAARVAAGAFFKALLGVFQLRVFSQVLSIGDVFARSVKIDRTNIDELSSLMETSPLHCADKESEASMIEAIDRARGAGESLGGSFEIAVLDPPPGLGSYVSWEQRLDSRVAAALMSIPAIKAVEIGDGVANAMTPGSVVHDELFFNQERGIYRRSNNAGGIEGGMSNGQTIWARAYMKPIPTLTKPLASLDTERWVEEKATVERSDICAVPAAAVVGEAMMAFVLAQAFMEKFGGDNLDETGRNYAAYRDYLKREWKWEKI